jgi:hypothetical protein
MSPASGHHAGVKTLAFQAGGKLPTTHGYHLKPLDITLGNTKHNFSLFQACVKMKPTSSIVYFLVSSS